MLYRHRSPPCSRENSIQPQAGKELSSSTTRKKSSCIRRENSKRSSVQT
ncbi:unnamed protein product [Angiostrongylus costaricensis]|uniref:Uncharacterized protein n=1 Tax=Angiostrongylus costaricensis TaxID=334426 RepID=A0A0R3Q1Z2_ANGCS|nr:unnamed protein product [Angiostrongylus costaricensis]